MKTPEPDEAATDTVDDMADKDRDELTAQADRMRTKLLHTVETLDQRRHDAVDVGLQVRRHAAPIGITAGLLLGGIVATTALVAHHVASAPKRRRRERAQALSRFWKHPEAVGKRRSLFADLGRSLLLGLLTAAVMIPARKALTRFYG